VTGRSKFEASPREKLVRACLKNKLGVVVHACNSVIPATWEAEVGGLQSEASPGKSMRPYLKNKPESKRLEM
jgi:hypothetical protein